MPVPFVACRNKVTGALADVPETALIHMTDWVPIEDEPTEKPWSAPAEPKPDTSTVQNTAGDPAEPAARTAKSKAAPSAITEKE